MGSHDREPVHVFAPHLVTHLERKKIGRTEMLRGVHGLRLTLAHPQPSASACSRELHPTDHTIFGGRGNPDYSRHLLRFNSARDDSMPRLVGALRTVR
jgi:hypothetical protein